MMQPRHKYFLPPPRSAPPRSARSDCAGVRFAAPRASPAFRPASPHSSCSTRASSSREFLPQPAFLSPCTTAHGARAGEGAGEGAGRGAAAALCHERIFLSAPRLRLLLCVLPPLAHLKRVVQSQRFLHTLGNTPPAVPARVAVRARTWARVRGETAPGVSPPRTTTPESGVRTLSARHERCARASHSPSPRPSRTSFSPLPGILGVLPLLLAQLRSLRYPSLENEVVHHHCGRPPPRGRLHRERGGLQARVSYIYGLHRCRGRTFDEPWASGLYSDRRLHESPWYRHVQLQARGHKRRAVHEGLRISGLHWHGDRLRGPDPWLGCCSVPHKRDAWDVQTG